MANAELTEFDKTQVEVAVTPVMINDGDIDDDLDDVVLNENWLF